MPTFTAPDGTRLAYRTAGTGEPLICVPGGAMRAGAYLGDLGGLDAHRQLVFLDLRGTGASDAPADPDTYRCDRQVGDIEALREHLGLDRVDLLAHSAGSNLALLYAAAHPARVRQLALITPTLWAVGIPVTPEQRSEAARLRSGEPWFDEAWPVFEARLRGEEAEGPFQAFFYGRWDAQAKAHAADSPMQINMEAALRYGSEGAFDPPATRGALAALDADVLVLSGELDGCPRPQVARELEEVLPRAQFDVQPGAGHFPWLDDPGAFRRTVAAFFDPSVHSARTVRGRLAYTVSGPAGAPPVRPGPRPGARRPRRAGNAAPPPRGAPSPTRGGAGRPPRPSPWPTAVAPTAATGRTSPPTSPPTTACTRSISPGTGSATGPVRTRSRASVTTCAPSSRTGAWREPR